MISLHSIPNTRPPNPHALFTEHLLYGTVDKINSALNNYETISEHNRLIFRGAKEVQERDYQQKEGKIYELATESIALRRETGIGAIIDDIKIWFSSKFFVNFQYMDSNGETKEVSVNVGSLAKRIGLSRSEILSAAEKCTLEEQVIAKTKEKQEFYLKYDEKIEAQANQILKTYKGIEQSGLNKDLMKKVIKLALTVPVGTGETPYALIRVIPKTLEKIEDIENPDQFMKALSSLDDQQDILLTKDNNNQLKTLANLSVKEHIGNGNFGTVSRVQNTINGQPIACKTPLNEQGMIDMPHEVANLKAIHKKGIRKGTQKPPHLFVNLKHQKVILMDEYTEGTLFDHLHKSERKLKLNIKESIDNLIQDLNHYARMGLINEDIKTENIFVTKNKKGELVCQFGDWGGARFAHQFAEHTTSTQEYCSNLDAENIREKAEKKNQALVMLREAKKGQDKTKIAEARAKYQEALIGFHHAHVDQMIYLVGIVLMKISTNYGEEKYFPMIGKMIDPDPNYRITLNELIESTNIKTAKRRKKTKATSPK